MTTLGELLPRLHRRRDEESGRVLQALLAVIEEQRDLLSDSVDQLYDDWFVETCQEWLVPYLGELVGHATLRGYEEELSSGTDDAGEVLRAIVPRRDVADAVTNRRRKGTLAILEELAADVAALPTRAVELRQLLAYVQPVRLYGTDPVEVEARLARGRLVDVRKADALDRVDGPFDELAHLVDVRRVDSGRRRGRSGIEQVVLYGWRLGSMSATRAPALRDDRETHRFSFSLLGNDTPLVAAPLREPDPTHVAEEVNLPVFIRRLAFERSLDDYYGPGKSLCVYLDDEPVPATGIVAADLTGWRYRPRHGTVAIDPVLGRIAFPSRQAPGQGVWVDYRYAFPADIGGGEYVRPATTGRTYRCGNGQTYATIAAALAAWASEKRVRKEARQATVELVGSEDFTEQVRVEVEPGDRLTIRAAPGSRPVVRLLDYRANRPDTFAIVGLAGDANEPAPTVTLDGLTVTGRQIRVEGSIGVVVVRHCTLVPGWGLDSDCTCQSPGEPSIELDQTTACLEVERSILGPVKVLADRTRHEPTSVYVSGSVMDAEGADGLAVVGEDDGYAYVDLSMRSSTVFGGLRVHGLSLVEDSIVTGRVTVVRRQRGCLRFSWIHPTSRTPARFHCEPETSGDPDRPDRLVPRFTSRTYGTPAYAQLSVRCPVEVARGAESGSEMGVYHDLYWPQRSDNLELRLDEYVPAGTDVGIHTVT